MLRRLRAPLLLLLLIQFTLISCAAGTGTSSRNPGASSQDTVPVPTQPVPRPAGAASSSSSASLTFPDVKETDWFYEVVTGMTEKGWLTGLPDGRFHPTDTISRAEFVTVVARAAGASEATQTQTDHWAAGWLQTALDRGWYDWDEIPPTGETFSQSISRQLAGKIVMKAFLPDRRGDYNTQSARMKDFAQLDGRYYDTVLAAYEAGVITGDGNGNFRPKDGLSRAEACAVVWRAWNLAAGGSPGTSQTPQQPQQPQTPAVPEQPVETRAGGVSENGRLKVVGTQLCNEKGQPVVLRGMSTHGMQWFPQFASEGAIRTTAEYGANVFRIAMYTDQDGYLSHPDTIRAKVFAAADAAIRQDMYVILDWHILYDGNPRTHQSEAVTFFTEAAKRYHDSPNVLYEICNEPNGNVSWSADVKPYAQAVVKAIRAQDPAGVILIGSPTWSQDIHLAAADPVEGTNLMYTLHFYAGTHGAELRNRIDEAMAKGLPVFVSEWGTSRASGGDGVFLSESATWLDFLAKRGISWCNWSLCDLGESSAALKSGANPDGGWTQENLSESGRFVFSRFKG